jgi:glutamate synthase (NADPH/NADH) small chain
MGEPTGFLRYERKVANTRPVAVRIRDWKEVYEEFSDEDLRIQGARCMDCGIPFCHEGCPLGNLIPEWNDFVYKDDIDSAIERLHATNNFPDFTGRLCPAPCEAACVLGINAPPVSIKQIEHTIADRAFERGLIPQIPTKLTGKKVAVVGSGPAGLAAAQQLRRAGHEVDVYERAEKPGGLLRYGIPEFKMEKWVLDKRLAQMGQEGVNFICNTWIGEPNEISATLGNSDFPQAKHLKSDELTDKYDAVLLSCGSSVPRDLPLTNRNLDGIYFAMQYLKRSNLVTEGTRHNTEIDANEKDVVIIGGGDTGADCLGTCHRQGAKSVVQLEILNRPPDERAPENPWPTWPVIFRTSTAHEEGGDRLFSVTGLEFLGDENNRVSGIKIAQVKNDAGSFKPAEGTEKIIPAQLVLLAMGFIGPEKSGLVDELGLSLNERGTILVDDNWRTTRDKVFACGDMVRGQSLIVWAIAEGRSAARAIDIFLEGDSWLMSPLKPYQSALS